MKTPDEIKKGLECCHVGECECDECTYKTNTSCMHWLKQDALAYIQQLESTISQVSKVLCGKENATASELLQAVSQVKDRLAQVERERNAAVRAISDAQHYIKNLGAVQYGLQQLEKWDYRIKQCGVCEENTHDQP